MQPATFPDAASNFPTVPTVHPSAPDVAEWINEAVHLSDDEKDILSPGKISSRKIEDLQCDVPIPPRDSPVSGASLDSWESEEADDENPRWLQLMMAVSN